MDEFLSNLYSLRVDDINPITTLQKANKLIFYNLA